MARNGWYASYFNTNQALNILEFRRIYREASSEDFSIAWDLYYLSLTLSACHNRRMAKIFLLIYGNIAVAARIIKDSVWIYESKECNFHSPYEVYFYSNTRSDLAPFLGYPELSIKRKNSLDILNALLHINPSFSHRSLFFKRVRFYSKKLRECRLPKVIILEEGRSLEYRALYHYARNKEVEIEFSWRNACSYVYSPVQLSEDSNLDYPGRLHRPRYEKNIMIKMVTPVVIDGDVLIVVPTFNLTEDVLTWVRDAIKLIVSKNYFFSIHPSYPHLKDKILGLRLGEIDDNKEKYLDRYSFYVGCCSTLMKTAKDKGKQVYAIGFNDLQIEHMTETLSGFQIIDARR